MNEMRQQMKQMLRSGYTHSHGDSRNSHHSSEISASDFGEWVNGVELTRQDLDTIF